VRIYRHYGDVPDSLKGAVVAIGNFDGVHRGHKALIGEARRLATERGATMGVLAFEPHPQEFFHPYAERFRLTPFRTKARLLAKLGADVLYALAFDGEMAAKSAPEFVMDVLVNGLAAGHVVVGPDFRFGNGRTGNVTALAYMGDMEGFGVAEVEPVIDDTYGKISSTTIRDALRAGRPEEAARLLGHYWTVESRVAHGDKRGRELGFPTANMRLGGTMKPAFGIYAVRATVLDADKPVARYGGVANFGIRPMFETPTPLLETHLFDFTGDLYGQHLAVELISYLRPEAKFSSLEALQSQIAADAEAAKRAIAASLPALDGAEGR
jgi:riboflavin kinase/FMN adenylyltransferase